MILAASLDIYTLPLYVALPITASTLVGVAALWQPGLLVEVDAVLVIA